MKLDSDLFDLTGLVVVLVFVALILGIVAGFILGVDAVEPCDNVTIDNCLEYQVCGILASEKKQLLQIGDVNIVMAQKCVSSETIIVSEDLCRQGFGLVSGDVE